MLATIAVVSCNKKATPAQCEEIIDRYATLVVKERLPHATAADIDAERAREKAEAHGDDAFKNCTAEVEASGYTCAMAAKTPDALERCLE